MDAETHAKYAKTMLKQYNLTKVKLSEKSIAECRLGGIVSKKNKIRSCNIYNAEDLILYPIL